MSLPSPNVPLVALLPAVAADSECLYGLMDETMRGHVEATWGHWNEAAMRQFLRSALRGRGVWLIRLLARDLPPVGALMVSRLPRQVRLEQLFIAPAFQRRGIGTMVLRSLLDEARAQQVPLHLSVLKTHPGRAWYERLGLRVVDETPERYVLEWRP
ncbi:GNAT family N-acetyltransferase [Caldimonas brevitalea]|uniref:Acetyltransferase n=1 Tax=Caldimonas brevitalea TaxID=413882 RepID=A0A0G3BJC4_9BURK|nr:GNAT family N-acetyltransferase [Caldimonas brevitalea]AKJ28093.1 acetyltransferase [Caldimonas brevitalea]